ncbi:fungal-specific transcription factor domain-containing protein [Triangularia verruculosa]|uniref:Fungal-specific transcription factor domain-containing protein n=1 Tax=Triangularia verruculosa TaxID=2587418 RepID=A0AAN7ARA8_9PEZI|nr:fungal-specific transcription factor domain-containing protein [Triangularia verruculosa]
MGDYYHHFLSSMAGVGGQPSQSPLEGPPQMSHQPQMIAMGGPPMPSPYQSLGYFTGFPEPIMFNAPKTQRSRRKSAPGLDHIKHRRTRSGCFTCRSRRVKCDETHPICERCRKGKRECLYPEPAPPKGAGGSASKESSSAPSQQASPTSSRGDDDDDDDRDSKLEPIMDEDEEEPQSATSTTAPLFPLRRSSTTSSFGMQRAPPGYRYDSETPSLDGNKSSSPLSTGTATAQQHRPDWTFLPHELQFYLGYFYDNITHYHYGLVTDAGDFFRTTLVGLALRNEALLYAIAAFSAYHHALNNAHGRINEFLQYYNHSVKNLLECLKRKEKFNVATLLTILQLGTIEEYLGDWVNLMGHQKAALEIFTQLFTPQTVMQSQLGRAALMWYARFDLFVAIMGGLETTLSRDWYLEATTCHDSGAAAEPDNTSWKVEACSAKLQLISMEMATLYAKRAKGQGSGEDFASEHQRLSRCLEDWKAGWDPALTDPSHLVTDFSGSRTPDPNDIVNPFTSGALLRPPLFASTILTASYHSMSLLHNSQSDIRLTEQARVKMTEHSYRIFQIFEAVELWPHSPPGALIALQSSLAVATLNVQRDPRHQMWVRRKFVLLEAMGYIFPATMRNRMAELFSDETCTRWWLPNDEDFPPLLQNIRAYADERNVMAASTQRDTVQQIRHVFSRMNLAEAARDPTQN